VRNSLLFSNVRVNSYSRLEDSVVLPDVTIGRNCRITRAVIDRGCEIPEGTVIGEDPAADAERFHVSEGGVVLVTPEMLGQVLHYVR
jgi:glucose-1-phosphate adenylyltransferase